MPNLEPSTDHRLQKERDHIRKYRQVRCNQVINNYLYLYFMLSNFDLP